MVDRTQAVNSAIASCSGSWPCLSLPSIFSCAIWANSWKKVSIDSVQSLISLLVELYEPYSPIAVSSYLTLIPHFSATLRSGGTSFGLYSFNGSPSVSSLGFFYFTYSLSHKTYLVSSFYNSNIIK